MVHDNLDLIANWLEIDKQEKPVVHTHTHTHTLLFGTERRAFNKSLNRLLPSERRGPFTCLLLIFRHLQHESGLNCPSDNGDVVPQPTPACLFLVQICLYWTEPQVCNHSVADFSTACLNRKTEWICESQSLAVADRVRRACAVFISTVWNTRYYLFARVG